MELVAEKEELLHASNLEKEEIIAKYEADKQEAQEEFEIICQVITCCNYSDNPLLNNVGDSIAY